MSMRTKQLITLLLLLFFGALTVFYMRKDRNLLQSELHPIPPGKTESAQPPLQVSHDSHPIPQLIDAARKKHEATLKKQSKTLGEAVAEYRRRYKIAPPPNFDKWFNFAKEKGVQYVDEYDTIYHSLLPFWSLEPSVIRKRAKEAIGYVTAQGGDNFLMGVSIRGGKVTHINQRGDGWQQEATKGMMMNFIQHLPDMDLAFNIHDEPRVVIPHDDLVRLLKKATDQAIPAAAAKPAPRNAWSTRPADVNEGKGFEEFRITRFNKYAHQPTWTDSRQSCPPESPSRSLNESAPDEVSSYAFSSIGFVGNKTAFSDICNSPSLRETFGFFDRPNAFDIVHDLYPIFSQSKVSSFQDILYPSPWYWADKVPYKPSEDKAWATKKNRLYWRGSTTGGFSRDGGWKRQHRQHVVGAVNALDKVNILEPTGGSNDAGVPSKWQLKEVSRAEFQQLFSVFFSHVGQCDPGDCDAQKEYFVIAHTAAQEDAWKYKYLLDMDGNAFSGRFYAFLKSRSLVFKMAVFREWHEEWIRPWLHYVPLSLHAGEYVEVLRFFDREEEGKKEAPMLAEAGRDWATKALRNVDLEVWFFRLLLEYGRLVDDNRETIGFTL